MVAAMPHLGTVSNNIETSTRAGEFIAIARFLCLAKGDLPLAAHLAESSRTFPRVASVLKGAVSAGSLDTGNYAALGELPGLIAAFLDSLRSVGVFDRLMPDMRRVPLRTRISVTTAGAVGAAVGSGMVKPISSLQLAGKSLLEKKAIAIVVVTDELVKLAGDAGAGLFARELRKAVALVTDQSFVATIIEGLSPITSSGGTAAAVRQDFGDALLSIHSDDSSKFYVLMPGAIAKALAVMGDLGHSTFPQMGPQGGIIFNMPAIVSDAVASDQIAIVDANQFAASPGTLDTAVAAHASIQMETAPDSPPSGSTAMQSLWQTGTVALKVERYFGCERLRDTAAAVINGISYGVIGSPT